MPYINQEQRQGLDSEISALAEAISKSNVGSDINPGVVNYAITKLIISLNNKNNYKNYNALIGALECCKIELYRRRIAGYEDEKIHDNGDVY